MTSGSKKQFESKAAKMAASRIESEEMAVFGGVSAPKRKARTCSGNSRIAFKCDDEFYFRLWKYVKSPECPYSNVSDFVRDTVADRLDELGA